MRIACVWIAHFAARVAQLRDPALRGRPVVVCGSGEARHRVVACTASAERARVEAGRPVREVTALCPEAVIVPEDPVAGEAAWSAILAALLLVSPVVESEAAGTAYLDLKGLYGLYAAPPDLMTAIERALRPEWRARVG